MKNTDFLNDLVSQHKPVKGIAPLKRDALSTVLFTAGFAAISIYLMGFRDDFSEVVQNLFFNLEGFFLVVTLLLGIAVSLYSVRPGLIELKKFKYLTLALFFIASLLVLNWCKWLITSPNPIVFSFEYGKLRLLEVITIMGAPLIWLIFQMRKGMLLRPWITFLSVSVTMGALSTLCLHLACCPFHPAQILIWHFMPAFLISLIAMLMWKKAAKK